MQPRAGLDGAVDWIWSLHLFLPYNYGTICTSDCYFHYLKGFSYEFIRNQIHMSGSKAGADRYKPVVRLHPCSPTSLGVCVDKSR